MPRLKGVPVTRTSMMRSVAAMAKTPSEKASSLPVVMTGLRRSFSDPLSASTGSSASGASWAPSSPSRPGPCETSKDPAAPCAVRHALGNPPWYSPVTAPESQMLQSMTFHRRDSRE